MPEKTRVVNRKVEMFDVSIGRDSKWGNPFFIGAEGNTREAVIAKYRSYLLCRPDLLAALEELRGKRLGCFCAPAECHGDVLVELLENPDAMSGCGDDRFSSADVAAADRISRGMRQ
jgi:hypothetical protein